MRLRFISILAAGAICASVFAQNGGSAYSTLDFALGAGTGSDITLTYGSINTYESKGGNGVYSAYYSSDYSGFFGEASASVSLTANSDPYIGNNASSLARLTYEGMYITNTGSSREKVIFDTSMYSETDSFASGPVRGEAYAFADIDIPDIAYAALGSESWVLLPDGGGESYDAYSTVPYHGIEVSDPYTFDHTFIFSLAPGASEHIYAQDWVYAIGETRLASSPSPAAFIPFGLSALSLLRKRRRFGR